jgi:hypothetical protein
MLRIADVDFTVVSCQLEASCNSAKMQWDIVVKCAPHPDRKFQGLAPSLSLSLFKTSKRALRHWTKLAPREVRWVRRNDTDVTPSGLLYLFEHTPIFKCYARCSLTAGNMQVELDGKCDVHYDEEYSENLDLHLESRVVFRGVWFGRQPEAECRNKIARFLNADDFDFSLTEHGVSMLTPK